MAKHDFGNLLKVLKREAPDRPVLFELFMNPIVYAQLSQNELPSQEDDFYSLKLRIRGFKNGGYDYALIHGSDFTFRTLSHVKQKTISLNENPLICDYKTFMEYPWQNPLNSDYSRLDILKDELAEGMKLIIMGPGGVLENVIDLVGYDSLCFMLIDEPDLARELFDAVGSRLVEYYKICSSFDSVGALVSNDDWGFNTQTMLSPSDMRKYVFPWHKKIVDVIHASGKPAILHSCGNLESVMDDIINFMRYDAKHSFEDKILPVEEAYECWHKDIAILGGIDLNFLCTGTTEEIRERSMAMLKRTSDRGGYALGSGNSIPEYVPVENYLAMISIVQEY